MMRLERCTVMALGLEPVEVRVDKVELEPSMPKPLTDELLMIEILVSSGTEAKHRHGVRRGSERCGGQQRELRRLVRRTPEGRTRRARVAQVMGLQRMEFQAHDFEIGFAYAVGAVCPEDSPSPSPDPMGVTYVPTTRPGHRLPHAWLERDGRKVSTLDLVPRNGLVLLLGADGEEWRRVTEAMRPRDLPLGVLSIGPGRDLTDPDREWTRLREVGEAGAILVRPDGHVAWRSEAPIADMKTMLEHAFACVSGRPVSSPQLA